ncbi:CHAT domain-containing protein [Streptomyces sp. NPDC057748]|uniref:CHAT domain-containing protein n=1 Tax=unclassified Streptomyces TaxID=2593676 RepID=UPI00369AC364
MDKRAQLLASVRARLERATGGEESAVLEAAARAEVHGLAQLLSQPFDPEAAHALGRLHFHRSLALPRSVAGADREAAERFFVHCFITGRFLAADDGIPQELYPRLAERAVPFAKKLLANAKKPDAAPKLLAVTVGLWTRITRNVPEDHPDRAAWLSLLGAALRVRFQSTGDLGDLDAAVEAYEAAARTVPQDQAHHARLLYDLANVMRMRFTSTQELQDLDAAVAMGSAAVRAAPAGHPDRGAYLANLCLTLQVRFASSGEPDDLNWALEAGSASVRAAPEGNPDYADGMTHLRGALLARLEHWGEGDSAHADEAVEVFRRGAQDVLPGYPVVSARLLSELAEILEERFERTSDPRDLGEAVEASRAAVEAAAAGAGPLNHAGCLSNLGGLLRRRGRLANDLRDLNEAVEAGRTAVRTASDGHPQLISCLVSLGITLRDRFARTGDPDDLDEAVEMHRAAVWHSPQGAPQRALSLSNLTASLRARFLRTRDPEDLDASVGAARAAARATSEGDPQLAQRQVEVASILEELFMRTGDPGDLDEAVEAGRAAVRAAPEGGVGPSGAVLQLSIVLWSRYKATGNEDDLDEAVERGRAALRAAPPGHRNHIACLTNLGATLLTRFQRTGLAAELDEAIEVSRAAVQAALSDAPNRTACIINLGDCLQEQFTRTGDVEILDEAVELARTAVRAVPPGQPNHVASLSSLCAALGKRFMRTGELHDLDESVEVGRAAVRAAPPGHSHHATSLTDLAVSLHNRSEHTGALGDLDEAVQASRAVVRATPQGHRDLTTRLTNLSIILLERFQRTGVVDALDEAVETGRAAVQAAQPGHRDHATCLTSLGNALRARFERTGNQSDLRDLDEAVELGRAAVRAAPLGHPHHATSLANLGAYLRIRFEHTRDTEDLAGAVQAGRATTRATPADHPQYATYLFNLGIALREQSKYNQISADLEEALDLWDQVLETKTTSAWARIRAARLAADALAASDPGRAAGFLERAVLLLPEVAPRRLRRDDQQHALSNNTTGLAADATALALADTTGTARERAVRALRLAEAGRAVLLSQALETRDDLSELRAQYPELAHRFAELRETLDQDSTTSDAADPGRAAGAAIRERHHLAAELEDLLGRIRACKGFAAFGLPPTPDELLAEATHGPVVMFNVSHYRSDALLLTHNGITSLPLPGLTPDTVFDRVRTFYGALDEATAPDGNRIAAQSTLRHTLEWLWESAAEPVLAALGDTLPRAAKDQPLPRVWWAPGGLLGLLPLHAAGYHTDADDLRRRTVMDRVISSYTSTVRTLRRARSRRRGPVGDSKSLIVAMPTTPGHGPLPYVSEEARRIRQLLPNPVELTEPRLVPDGELRSPEGEGPTTATVLGHLTECSIAHFACHGVSDRANPAFSRLLLHDHATTPLTVSALARLDLDARLAYLSACSTADPGTLRLRDEAIHLSSACQLSGFTHVIGTLWPINDRLAATIAASFYTRLSAGTGAVIDPDQAAVALHHAIRSVRNRYPSTPSLWAAHLHAGA